jgi:hypothetical protein
MELDCRQVTEQPHRAVLYIAQSAVVVTVNVAKVKEIFRRSWEDVEVWPVTSLF